MWAERRKVIAEKEFVIAEKMLARAEEMLATPLFRRTSKDGKIIIEPTRWTEADISRISRAASDLARRAANLPNNIVAVDDWRKSLEDAGVDAGEVFESIIATLAAADRDGDDAPD